MFIIDSSTFVKLANIIRNKLNITDQVSVSNMTNYIKKLDGKYAWKRISPSKSQLTESNYLTYNLVNGSATMKTKTVYFSNNPPVYNTNTQRWELENYESYVFDNRKSSANISLKPPYYIILGNYYIPNNSVGNTTKCYFSSNYFKVKTTTYNCPYNWYFTYRYYYYHRINIKYAISDNYSEYPTDGSQHTDGYYYMKIS